MRADEKLVRDGIPAILAGKNIAHQTRVAADDAEYEAALIKKVLEEAREFTKSGGSSEEFGDLLEVMDTLRDLPRYADVLELQHKKWEECGGFENRTILLMG